MKPLPEEEQELIRKEVNNEIPQLYNTVSVKFIISINLIRLFFHPYHQVILFGVANPYPVVHILSAAIFRDTLHSGTVGPVSYTHLDVYKRQDMNSGSDYMDLIVFNSKKGCETFIIRVRNAV